MKFENKKVNKLIDEVEGIQKRISALRKRVEEQLAKMQKQAA
tara:strand:- start:4234 stop:4359 length:126 start_codon:yes stop_codon:yes gene_type:complete